MSGGWVGWGGQHYDGSETFYKRAFGDPRLSPFHFVPAPTTLPAPFQPHHSLHPPPTLRPPFQPTTTTHPSSYVRHRAAVPPGRLVEVGFAQLEADPVAALERVYTAFG